LDDFIYGSYGRNGMAEEYISDARKIPIQSKLEEMCNVANINIAIIDILDADQEDIKQSIKIIKDLQKSMSSNYQFAGVVKQRLEILE